MSMDKDAEFAFDDYYDDSLDADDFATADEFEQSPDDILDEFDDDIYGDSTEPDPLDESIESEELREATIDFEFCDIGV